MWTALARQPLDRARRAARASTRARSHRHTHAQALGRLGPAGRQPAPTRQLATRARVEADRAAAAAQLVRLANTCARRAAASAFAACRAVGRAALRARSLHAAASRMHARLQSRVARRRRCVEMMPALGGSGARVAAAGGDGKERRARWRPRARRGYGAEVVSRVERMASRRAGRRRLQNFLGLLAVAAATDAFVARGRGLQRRAESSGRIPQRISRRSSPETWSSEARAFPSRGMFCAVRGAAVARRAPCLLGGRHQHRGAGHRRARAAFAFMKAERRTAA